MPATAEFDWLATVEPPAEPAAPETEGEFDWLATVQPAPPPDEPPPASLPAPGQEPTTTATPEPERGLPEAVKEYRRLQRIRTPMQIPEETLERFQKDLDVMPAGPEREQLASLLERSRAVNIEAAQAAESQYQFESTPPLERSLRGIQSIRDTIAGDLSTILSTATAETAGARPDVSGTPSLAGSVFVSFVSLVFLVR